VHSFAGDDWRDCRDYVRQRLGLPEWEPGDEQDRRVPIERNWDIRSVDQEAQLRERSEDDLRRIASAARLWNESQDARSTLAEKYLREERMLDAPADLFGRVLRFNHATPWRDESTGRTIYIPALVVPFRDVFDDQIVAVHRIRLTLDGNKVDRRMLGCVQRAAIKLGTVANTLVIGEGLETAMAATELGYKPAWALGSVGAIARFTIIPSVNTLVILAETGEASENATKICTRRWHAAGKRVRIATPDPPHSDLNDELISEKRRTAA
jgi:hypothetical protein